MFVFLADFNSMKALCQMKQFNCHEIAMGGSIPKLLNLILRVYLSKDLEKQAHQKDYLIYTLRMMEKHYSSPQ